jgi:hypothetical protein
MSNNKAHTYTCISLWYCKYMIHCEILSSIISWTVYNVSQWLHIHLAFSNIISTCSSVYSRLNETWGYFDLFHLISDYSLILHYYKFGKWVWFKHDNFNSQIMEEDDSFDALCKQYKVCNTLCCLTKQNIVHRLSTQYIVYHYCGFISCTFLRPICSQSFGWIWSKSWFIVWTKNSIKFMTYVSIEPMRRSS